MEEKDKKKDKKYPLFPQLLMVVNMGMNPENYYYQHPFKDEWICGETFHKLAEGGGDYKGNDFLEPFDKYMEIAETNLEEMLSERETSKGDKGDER